MAFDAWTKVNQIRQKHGDAIYFYADLEEQRFEIETNDFLPKELQPENGDLLQALCESDRLEPAEQKKAETLRARIRQGRQEAIKMTDIETFVQLTLDTGYTVTVSILCYLETDEDGLITAYVGLIHMLRVQELRNRKILATFSNDKNPSYFMEQIAAFQAEQPDRQYAYIQFDIRKFKYVNEKYGSDVGDEILNFISDTLDVMCDETQLHCRLAADIFEIVTYFTTREEITVFIERLDEKIRRFGKIKLGISYGVSVAPGTSTAYRKHGDEAGLARAQGKSMVVNKVVFYEDTWMRTVHSAGAIEEAEEEALKNGEFHVFFQPKYMYDKNRARIVGAEALVRWIDSEGKCKSPAEFIPVFEKNGFIFKLDCFVWETVCQLIRKWMDEGKEPLPISVNVSRAYLKKKDVAGYIKNLVESYQIPIGLLQLEITETTESAETLAYINRLKEEGFTLLMDDFGSGYSSLSMLKDTPFDVLKMDRFFLDECLNSRQGKAIVSHVISMSNDIGLSIVAEGVENKDTADFLFENGCEVSQGYYFSKPVPVDEFERLRDKRGIPF